LSGPAQTSPGGLRLTDGIPGGTCTFDVNDRRISIVRDGSSSRSVRLDTPPPSVIGDYLSIVCGEDRTLLVTERRIVVTLGMGAVSRGQATLPGLGASAFSVDHNSIGSRPAAWTAGSDAEHIFLISEDGTLIFNDTASTGDGFLRTGIGDLFEFPLSRVEPVMRYHDGMLFLFQPGSRRIAGISINPSSGRIVTTRYSLLTACPASPRFSESGDVLVADLGTSTVRITVNAGHATVVEAADQP
jgi:hypothetical protein